jgi:hypothetical protein
LRRYRRDLPILPWMRVQRLIVSQRQRWINRHQTLHGDHIWHGLDLAHIAIQASHILGREGVTRGTNRDDDARRALLREVLRKLI